MRDRVDLGAITMKETPHSLKLEHYRNLTIILFSILSRTLVGESNPFAHMQSVYSIAPVD